MNKPIVYFKPGCPFGIRLRTALTLHRVPYRSVRFRDDEEAAARVRDVNGGNEISPTVHMAGRWLTNPAGAKCGTRIMSDSEAQGLDGVARLKLPSTICSNRECRPR